VTTGTFIYFAGSYSGSDILGTAITTTLPFPSIGNYPGIQAAAAGTNLAYQSWVDDNFDIILDYDGTTSLASLIGLTTLEIRISVRDIYRSMSASIYTASVDVKDP